MTRFYTSVDVIGNDVLVREIVDGIENKTRVSYNPHVYLNAKDGNGDLVSLFGEPVKKREFESIQALKDFNEQMSDVHGVTVYGQLNVPLQYLSSYPLTEEWSMKHIKAESIDIETRVPEDGFPNVIETKAEVVLITMRNISTRYTKTFGLRPYAGTDTNYVHCSTEKELFENFLQYWEQVSPHIVTGWNIEGFDLPYLVNRIEKVMKKGDSRRLSPWKRVSIRPSRVREGDLDVTISGVAILDYLSLMRKFTYGNRPSWSLAAVAQDELGHTKLDHSEHASFNAFMDNDWEKFVRYNVIDAKLICDMDDKMKLLSLIITIAYKARVNFQDVYSPVKTWDSIIHNALINKGKVVPQRRSASSNGPIEGAFVKEPIPGMYKYISSIDATSLYPSIMMLLNISPETFIGMTESSVELCLAGRWPSIDSDTAVGANGAMFNKKKLGIIPELIESMMAERKSSKGSMLKLESQYEVDKDENLQPKIAALNNIQMAMKILMNSLYGALANSGFRFFNSDVAETITTTGQLYLKSIDKNLSSMMVEKFKIPGKNYVVYADTDSVYISLEEVVNKFFPDVVIDKKIKGMEQTVQKFIQPMVGEICREVNEHLNVYAEKISFKLEIAADKAIFCSKKKYACRVYSSEGVTYAKPKLKVMGLEMVRSSTPMFIREKLKESLAMIFEKDEEAVQAYVEQLKGEFNSKAVEDISFPRGASNLQQYSDKRSIYVKGCPIHVRASLLYNNLVRQNNLQGKYNLVKEGEKVKFVYLKVPNSLKENIIAWPVDAELPKEFNLHRYVDYELQFEKTYISAISTILGAIGWSPVKIATLDDFF